jgi:hypothetical protein
MSSAEKTFTPSTGAEDADPGSVGHDFGPEPEPSTAEESEEASTGLHTQLAMFAALALAAATVFVATNTAGVGIVTASAGALFAAHVVLAAIAMVPMRWGYYVMPAVATVFYVYGMFEIWNGNVIVGGVLGTSFVGPASGIVVAFLSQLIYTFVGEG